ncbi:diaminopimelate decarboxylase [Leucobacter luti]|uniref:diaminopimelate decarboxylase n=1 Tax=Leucobacter luti TaxID=340320 RepID=UPI001047FC60|nr:diaminopimelate decarboxylase [Leucobacter luti]MCW2287079.1 diaminopimelate decarboxylase [Leucobacter luti]TCK41303.1 diaminopimelate decarboxylase [Leucobacter luti]
MTASGFYDPRFERIFPSNAAVRADGVLEVGGCSVPALTEEFGTPLYVIDEQGLRDRMRAYREGLAARWPNSQVAFASKSFPVLAAYAIAASEGLAIDVAGAGELLLALESGAPPELIHLHGNAKSHEELVLAVDAGIGAIVLDGEADVQRLDALLTRPQDVLVRIIPGVDPRVPKAISTGGATSKFGLPIPQAKELIARLAAHPFINVVGLHLHIGSQVLEVEPFERAVEAVRELGEFPVYNIGGGLGVNYNVRHNAPTLDEYLDGITAAASRVLPKGSRLIIEPGRSLVARSGMTAYRVNNVKRTGATFVAVDGGLADQLNVALMNMEFTPIVADRASTQPDTTAQLVGRQCESGDLLVDQAALAAPATGDTIVLAATGAYGYTLSNNYNGALKPAVVFCRNGESRLAVRRQTYAEFLGHHVGPSEESWAS